MCNEMLQKLNINNKIQHLNKQRMKEKNLTFKIISDYLLNSYKELKPLQQKQLMKCYNNISLRVVASYFQKEKKDIFKKEMLLEVKKTHTSTKQL